MVDYEIVPKICSLIEMDHSKILLLYEKNEIIYGSLYQLELASGYYKNSIAWVWDIFSTGTVVLFKDL